MVKVDLDSILLSDSEFYDPDAVYISILEKKNITTVGQLLDVCSGRSNFKLFARGAGVEVNLQLYGFVTMLENQYLRKPLPIEHLFEKKIDFENPSKIQFAKDLSASRVVSAKAYPEASVSVNVNKNLISYYASAPYFTDYPWGLYARQPMDGDLQKQLFPILKEVLKNKTEQSKVSILLNFVQFGFQYATDEEQFGYEKPFFLEENFYYPKNDCEDRSILFSYLVRKLVGLDVVLLYSPGHLWSAVHFNSEIDGDYITVDNKKYTICDPTYIGASIGMTQPAYKGKRPIVVQIK